MMQKGRPVHAEGWFTAPLKSRLQMGMDRLLVSHLCPLHTKVPKLTQKHHTPHAGYSLPPATGICSTRVRGKINVPGSIRQPLTDGLEEGNDPCSLHIGVRQLCGILHAVSPLALSPRCPLLYSIHSPPSLSSLTSPTSVSWDHIINKSFTLKPQGLLLDKSSLRWSFFQNLLTLSLSASARTGLTP